MLPDVGGLELLVIAAVALIVVGPKDLPVMLRKLGQFTARIRGMANEFRASFDEMARQSELDELRKEVEAMRKGQILDSAAADASKVQVEQVFQDIGDSLGGTGAQFDPSPAMRSPVSEPPAPAAKAPAKPRAPRAAKPKAASAPKSPEAVKPKRTTAAKSSTPRSRAKPKAKT